MNADEISRDLVPEDLLHLLPFEIGGRGFEVGE